MIPWTLYLILISLLLNHLLLTFTAALVPEEALSVVEETTDVTLAQEEDNPPPPAAAAGNAPVASVPPVVNLSLLSTVKDENASYLDIFGEFSKEYIIHHLIPPTDAQCDWNWNYLRCEPFCICDYQYKLGDYHVGRSCRLRESNQEASDSTTKPNEQRTSTSTFDTSCHLPPNTKLYKVMNGIGNIIHMTWNRVNLPKQVDQVKERMCSSLDHTISLIHATYIEDTTANSNTSRMKSVETFGDEQHHERNLEEGDWKDQQQDHRDHRLLEKPVRALRRSLRCGDDHSGP